MSPSPQAPRHGYRSFWHPTRCGVIRSVMSPCSFASVTIVARSDCLAFSKALTVIALSRLSVK